MISPSVEIVLTRKVAGYSRSVNDIENILIKKILG